MVKCPTTCKLCCYTTLWCTVNQYRFQVVAVV